MKRALSLIREAPWYRRDAFARGLAAAGYEVASHGRAGAGDLLVIWNRYGANHALAEQAEKAGARVLVAENGYLGAGGTAPKFDVHPGGPRPEHYYALAEGWHNGGGSWPAGGPERFDALDFAPAPWRERGEHVLVCPNRSFGVPGRMMPPDWAQAAAKRLERQTKRPVRIRPHPGNNAPKRRLEDDLAGAWAVVIWTSGAGVHALARGIPVVCEAPYWICKSAAFGSLAEVEGMDPGAATSRRRAALERMAWAQWRLDEIETGAPFRALLG